MSAFLKRSMPKKKDEAIQDVLTRKAVVLEHRCTRRKKPKRRKAKTFTAKQRRELRLFEIEPEQQRCEREPAFLCGAPERGTLPRHGRYPGCPFDQLSPDRSPFLNTTTCDFSSNPQTGCNQRTSILPYVP